MSGNISLLSSWFRARTRCTSNASRTWKAIYCAAIISTTAGIFASAAGATPLLSGLREVYRQGRNSATRDKLYSQRLVQVLQGTKVHGGTLLPTFRENDKPSRASRVWQALRCTTAIQAVPGPCDTGEQSLLPRARPNRVDNASTSGVWASLRCQAYNQAVQGSTRNRVSILPAHGASNRRSSSAGTGLTLYSAPTVQSLSCSFDNGTPILQSPDAIYTGPGQTDLLGYLALYADIATRFTVRTDSRSGSKVSAEVHQEGEV